MFLMFIGSYLYFCDELVWTYVIIIYIYVNKTRGVTYLDANCTSAVSLKSNGTAFLICETFMETFIRLSAQTPLSRMSTLQYGTLEK